MAAPTTTKPVSTKPPEQDSTRTHYSAADHADDALPPLTAPLLASYNASHHRLLLWLCLALAFILSIFPVNDPDIFFSLEVGKMISAGEFPWGSDPFSYAQGEQPTWIHNGWLGDLLIYDLYELGGGPLLVMMRAILVTLLFWMLARLGKEKAPRFWTVLVVFLGVLTISQRLYFRTELFSLVLLGLLLSLLARSPKEHCWFNFFHRYTSGRWYWLIPVLFVFWANLDGWFFLGLGTCILWCLGCWLNPGEMTKNELRSLTLCTGLSIVACCVTPFHIKSFLQIPARLTPAIAGELHARFDDSINNYVKLRAAYEDQRRQFLDGKLLQQDMITLRDRPRYSEQLRQLASPLSWDYASRNLGADAPENLGLMTYLTLFYPNGLSISEWAFYPLLAVVLLSLIFATGTQRVRSLLLMVLFVILGCWQTRFLGFFVVGGVAMAVLNIQSQAAALRSVNRASVLGMQLICLPLGLLIQGICILHLIPTPDLSPLTLGYVHPRGAFGIAFRSDPLMQQACKTMDGWQLKPQQAGNAVHLNWSDIPAYQTWFNPGSKHFFDRRFELFDQAVTKDYQTVTDSIQAVLTDPIKSDFSNINKMFERQEKWQEVFQRYHISHLIVTKRGQQRNDLVTRLLAERDKQNHIVWKPLQLHNGQVYALAWAGSPYWKSLAALEFNAEQEAFRRERPEYKSPLSASDMGSFSRYVYGDAARRPAALDESIWHQQYESINPELLVANQFNGLGETMMRLILQLNARGATPFDTSPFFPLFFSSRHGSAASLLLSLESVRRAAAEITPDTPAYLRAEVYVNYVDTIKMMIGYESRFTPVAPYYHTQQLLYLLRQAAIACAESMHPQTFLRNMELAKEYRTRGVLDASMEHYQIALNFLEQEMQATTQEKRKSDIAAFLKNADANCTRLFEFSPTQVETLLKQQTQDWEQTVKQQNWIAGSPKDALNRASMAFRAGLIRKALEELQLSGERTVETTLLACDIYGSLGQHDIVMVEFLGRIAELRPRLGEVRFHSSVALGEWCLGRPEQAARHHLEIARVMNENALDSSISGSLITLFGTNLHPVGNVFPGTVQVQQAASTLSNISEHQVAVGLLHLEAGKPQQAVEMFVKVLRDTNPATPWRPLLERYYLQITGKLFE